MNPTIFRVTYVDADPVREHLRMLGDAGVTMYRVAKITEIPLANIHRILHHGQKRLRSDTAELITHVTVADAEASCRKPVARLDSDTLQKLLRGHGQTVPAHDKPAYVRALRARGWAKHRIGQALRMSGSHVNQALDNRVTA